jgi:hypothetical protein
MKSKFEIHDWCERHETDTPLKCSDLVNIYNKYYSEQGYEFNTGSETVFKMFDKEYNLSKGDVVYLDDYYIVTDKWMDIEQDYVHYVLKEEGNN